MKYIFDKPVTEYDILYLSIKEMSDQEITTCYDKLPNLEILSERAYTSGFVADKEGWFTNHTTIPLGNLVKFEEVFSDE